ncbi:MAG: NADPH:quinone oxidoreductase family protein [Alphaproteobacteria bacterium]|nr:NADPH:quinone oxidoreductase family protein [Alphaproteobacteria bacterium]
MKAMLCWRFCQPEDLEWAEAAEPPLPADGVRIAVRAAALNFPDLLMLRGQYQYRPAFPFAPGMECAGEVLEVGPAVSGLRPGDRVAAHPWDNCFAERVVAPAALVFPVPWAMDDATAAAFSIAYGTVYHALIDRAEVRAGETLLVLGAAGGIGLPAIEIGKLLGATVIAAARGAEKLSLARDYGADHALDYAVEDLPSRVKQLTGGRGADVCFDPVGGALSLAALSALGWGGRLLILGFAGGAIARLPSNRLLIKGQEVIGCGYHRFNAMAPAQARANMSRLLAWWQAGRLRPHLGRRFAMAEVATAMRAMAERRLAGKAVLTL